MVLVTRMFDHDDVVGHVRICLFWGFDLLMLSKSNAATPRFSTRCPTSMRREMAHVVAVYLLFLPI